MNGIATDRDTYATREGNIALALMDERLHKAVKAWPRARTVKRQAEWFEYVHRVLNRATNAVLAAEAFRDGPSPKVGQRIRVRRSAVPTIPTDWSNR